MTAEPAREREITAWNPSTSSLDVAPVILKAMPASAYQMPAPVHPADQVNPDGVAFAAVSDLPSLTEPDVRAWVTGHEASGVLIMACFARGMETGQGTASYEAQVTLSEYEKIRVAANRELAAHLGPLGWRTDHLTA
jgi:hypothetical protein